jgi:hypothetical protein
LTLLVTDFDKHIANAQAWRDPFREQLPNLEIRIWPKGGKCFIARLSEHYEVSRIQPYVTKSPGHLIAEDPRPHDLLRHSVDATSSGSLACRSL